MLAWVCWDEFVNLESPYGVKWMEKCNEAHISALRILMRGTLCQAVASRKHSMQPGSPQTGQLMSSLLMAAMSKLAGLRTSAPSASAEAGDTATKLMRGLFGNLLTMAGSGVRPMSMVWQLFGLESQLDVPTTPAEWAWYEAAVALYPYTGWPLEQFHNNLKRLLDKVIVRVVTRNEDGKKIKVDRIAEMVKYCKLRNIQLHHSRTIITTLMRMLTTEGTTVAVVASRLLQRLPHVLEKQSRGYKSLIAYLEHLAAGKPRRAADDLIAASTFNKRSATFGILKTKVADACKANEWARVKRRCQRLLDKHEVVAKLWGVDAGEFEIQNVAAYKALLEEDGADEEAAKRRDKLAMQVISDAEKERVPWQVGKKGQFGDIEPLDEAFVQEMLTGQEVELSVQQGETAETELTAADVEVGGNPFEEFKSHVSQKFIRTMQKDLSAEHVCGILGVPASTMRTFVKALSPEFVWENLGGRFKAVLLGLLRERSGRAGSRPTDKLLGIRRGKLQIGY